MKPYAIHWFRRDLRIAGNEALKHCFKKFEGRVLGVFSFDKAFLSRGDFSVNRFQLFLKTLSSLRDELRASGSDLLFLDVGPQAAFPELLKKLKVAPDLFTYSRDYEPFARRRDVEIEQMMKEQGIPCRSFRDHLIVEPHELIKEGGEPPAYKVYSPFARKWQKIFKQEGLQTRIDRQKMGLKFLKNAASAKFEKIFNIQWADLIPENTYPDNLQKYIDENQKAVTVPIPEVGSKAVLKALQGYKDGIGVYRERRNFPAIKGTSGFSIYLKNGSLTTAQIMAFFDLATYQKVETSRDRFLSELIWREFYYHILFHWPHAEHEAFNPKCKDIPWENNKDWFRCWQEGTTGFPIVDAGMRELKTTGWMHNRVRMIVASFLTKDLLINWQWGEKHFMDLLLDGDLAPNNGGWQWAASTGCDPQPYFRIFNPWSQSEKFDKEGEYIQKYIPELRDLDPKQLHSPIEDHSGYPAPIVDHSVQRQKALAMFKQM